MNTVIGTLLDGSLSEGLRVKLKPGLKVEDAQVGTYVILKGEKFEYFSIITDIVLGGVSDEIILMPPETNLAKRVAEEFLTYTVAKIAPLLALDNSGQKMPVKTMPRHFSPLCAAKHKDFERVFGKEDSTHFKIGTPIGMDVPVTLDLDRFIERSNGVFGKSGTGKSYLTRLLLSGVIASAKASALIFDIHNEYGWSTRSESGAEVKGLRQLFGSTVRVFALDETSAKARSVKPDSFVKIGLNQLDTGDILILSEALNLPPTAAENAYVLEKNHGEKWIEELLGWDGFTINERAQTLGLNEYSLSAFQRKISQIEKLPFITKTQDESVISEILGHIERGNSVVLDFGRFRSQLAYLLVANVLSRRIYSKFVQQAEEAMVESSTKKNWPLMIVLEEAHNFLRPELARQTIFGTIARELRKYNVTLLVVDQRPSEIDKEVLSQLGTRITALLNDEKDIDSVFVGVPGGSMLKTILATLDSKEQALILGHAVPLSTVIQTRRIDAQFYKEIKEMGTDKEIAGLSDNEARDLLFAKDALR